MRQITIFKNFTQVIGSRTLLEIVRAIQQGVYQEEVLAVRRAVKRGDQKVADETKKTLHAFTVSGRFEGGRTMERLKEYHPYVILDIDKLDMMNLERVNKAVRELPYTHVAFLSPSGNGCKIIVKVNSNQLQHLSAFLQVAEFYEKKLQVKIDKSGKDITRLCFFSYDENLFYNENSKVFTVKETLVEPLPFYTKGKSEKAQKIIPLKQNVLPENGIEKCLEFTQQKMMYVEGNRNNFVYLFASNCNQEGISESEALSFALSEFDLDKREIRKAVTSSYQHHVSEFGSKPLTIKKNKEEIKIHFWESLKQTPLIPEKVFRLLPSLLKRGCEVFDESRERDVFLVGAMTVLSGALTKVEGVYDGCTSYPNLFSFIVAPAASGKGVLKFAKMLGDELHRKLLKESQTAIKDFEIDLMDYQMQVAEYKKRKRTSVPEAPEKPARNMLFIPANSSSAMIIQQLKDSGGWGVLCESEADTLGNTLKQDWGGYSDLLRKVFHFETISYSRKANDEFYEITHPRLSVAISGTPNQVLGLIPSAEDGLFSRFIFYVFNVTASWKKQSVRRYRKNLNNHFSELSKDVLTMLEWLEEHPTEIDMSDTQWQFFDEVFEDILLKACSLDGEEVLSTVKRLGVIMFRLVMVLSVIRKYENRDKAKDWICHDDDFQIAIAMVETFWSHANLLFETLPKTRQLNLERMPNRKKLFFQELPNQFKRSKAQEIGKAVGLKPRTVDKYLRMFLGKLLEQPEYGFYEKK